jgi:long-chain acyl-CoA synthetase
MGQFKDYPNIHAMLKETIDRNFDGPAFRWFGPDGHLEQLTWGGFYEQLRQVVGSLSALGIQKGDAINILSYSCFRWVLTDLAAVSMGAVSVGIYQSLLPPDCRYIIDHSDAKIVFVQDEIQLAKVQGLRPDLPAVEKVVMLSGEAPDDDWILSYDAFVALGQSTPAGVIDELIGAVSAQDLAALVYTSGTTGVPKGAMLTHDNITFTAQSVEKSVYWKPGDEVFLFLPLAHVFARTCVYTTILAGCATTFARGIDTIADDLKIARPNWFASVPRIFEKVHSKIIGGVDAKGGLAKKLFRLGTGNRIVGQQPEAGQKAHPRRAGVQIRPGRKAGVSKDTGRPRRPRALVHQRGRSDQSGRGPVFSRRRCAHCGGDRHDRGHLLFPPEPL